MEKELKKIVHSNSMEMEREERERGGLTLVQSLFARQKNTINWICQGKVTLRKYLIISNNI